MALIEILLTLTVLYAGYKYLTKNNEFFKKRGVKYVEPTLLFGNMFGLMTGRLNGWTVLEEIYNNFKNEKVYGMFMFQRPVFFIKDVEVVKQITVKDFDHFVNHDSTFSKNGDAIFAKSVLHLEDNPWREMRNTLTPIFTSAKIKTMFHHLTSCIQDLDEYFTETLDSKGRIVIEAGNIFPRFTAEAISTTTLGFKANCIKNEHSQVFQIALRIKEELMGTAGMFRQLLVTDYSYLAKLFNITIFSKTTTDFFKTYVSDEIARRESQGSKNNDVIELLIQAKNGQLKDEGNNNGKKVTAWSEELIIAQVFLFFAGGFETTSSLMQMCCWELAMNQDVQKQLVEEIDELNLSLNGKTVSYEALNKMKYLDMVVQEALRKWPPLQIGFRECNKDYKLVLSDGKTINFKVGDNLMIPFGQIQHDPKYFENPKKFDPLRFSDENKNSIVPGSFLSFGYGPRFCLGSRLALLETKLVFYSILSKYTIQVCEKTPPAVNYSTSLMGYKENVFVELKPRV